MAIFRECSDRRLEKFLESIEKLVNERNAEHSDAIIKYSVGTAFEEGENVRTLDALVALSDRRAWQQENG